MQREERPQEDLTLTSHGGVEQSRSSAREERAVDEGHGRSPDRWANDEKV